MTTPEAPPRNRQTFNLTELRHKLIAGQQLSLTEAQHVAELLTFAEQSQEAIEMSRHFDSSVIQLAAYPNTPEGNEPQEGQSDTRVPLFFIVAVQSPEPETWDIIQQALEQV